MTNAATLALALPSRRAGWLSPRDQLPAEGALVEISVQPDCRNIDRAKRLGAKWSVERTYGGPYLLHEPPAPAFWRPIAPSQARALEAA